MTLYNVHTRAVTIPAGTLRATPLVTPTVFPPNIVDHISWRFPGGCNGQVGIQIGCRAVAVLPSASTEFFISSGDTTGYDLSDLPDSGDFSVIGFNLGAFPHTIQVDFKVHRYERPAPLPGYLVVDTVANLTGGV